MEEHPGTADRVCVEVDPENEDQRDWRSGEFITGNFWIYLEEWPDDHDWGKLYWAPLHAIPMEEADDHNFLVRATLLDDPSGKPPEEAMHRSFTISGIAFSDEPDPIMFFPSQVQLPTSGTWMLVATSGPDWGCFLLTLPDEAD